MIVNEMDKLIEIPGKGRILFAPTIIFLILAFLLLLPACDSDSSSSETVVIAANPASIELGEQMVVELRSLEPIFTDKHVVPLRSENGLMFKELTVIDEKNALGTFGANPTLTEVGLHSFTLNYGEKKGVVEISVLAEIEGPGLVTIEDNAATAGAKYAKFSIYGENAHFDSQVSVSVENAIGMFISNIEVKTENWIEVSYEIDVEQEPTTATIILQDGPEIYEFPFEIINEYRFDNENTQQYLIKGQVGTLILQGHGPTLYSATHPVEIPADIEYGVSADVTEGVAIPFRVPVDYEGNRFSFESYTYLEDGSILEVVTTEVAVFEPIYAVPVPSVLPYDSGENVLQVTANNGQSLTFSNYYTEDNDGFVVSNWDALGALTVLTDSQLNTEQNLLEIEFSGQLRVPSQIIVSDGDIPLLFVANSTFYSGDESFLQLTLNTYDLIEGEISLREDNCFEVLDTNYIDPGSVVFRVAICDDMDFLQTGTVRELFLNVGERTYSFDVVLNEAEVSL